MPVAGVTPELIVTVEDGKMLSTGMVAVFPKLALVGEEMAVEKLVSRKELEPEPVDCESDVVDTITVDMVDRVDGVDIKVGVDETDESSVEMIGLDESPNAKDVDDCAGSDEAVVVELVNLLRTHGCFPAPSCLALCRMN